jgi:hypothetical protein
MHLKGMSWRFLFHTVALQANTFIAETDVKELTSMVTEANAHSCAPLFLMLINVAVSTA